MICSGASFVFSETIPTASEKAALSLANPLEALGPSSVSMSVLSGVDSLRAWS